MYRMWTMRKELSFRSGNNQSDEKGRSTLWILIDIADALLYLNVEILLGKQMIICITYVPLPAKEISDGR